MGHAVRLYDKELWAACSNCRFSFVALKFMQKVNWIMIVNDLNFHDLVMKNKWFVPTFGKSGTEEPRLSATLFIINVYLT